MEYGTITTKFGNVCFDLEHFTGTKPAPNERSDKQNVGFIQYISNGTKQGNLNIIFPFQKIGPLQLQPLRT